MYFTRSYSFFFFLFFLTPLSLFRTLPKTLQLPLTCIMTECKIVWVPCICHLPCMTLLPSPDLNTVFQTVVPYWPDMHLALCSRPFSPQKNYFPFLCKQVFILHAGHPTLPLDKHSSLKLNPFPLLSLAFCVRINTLLLRYSIVFLLLLSLMQSQLTHMRRKTNRNLLPM